MQYGCIGEHLPHSFSKIIHQKIGEYDYDLCELTPDEVGAFLEAKDFRAINVTIPYKETVIPYLSQISDSARAIGAVNTIVNRGGKLFGYNTDYAGMNALAKRTGISFDSKTVLILGTGGTAKTARAVAKDGGACEIFTASRSPKGNTISYEEAYALSDKVDVVINTTPCGMFPNVEGAAIDLSPFSSLCGVIDAVYNPLKTDLVLQAERMGVPAAGGLYMLVAQAVVAAGIFLDKTYPDALTERIYREILKEKRNLVLIGMPASGKTSVGRVLAQKTGRTWIDTDAQIESAAGKTCAEIIREDGIEEFRRQETAVLKSLAPLSGAILATGGGAILREENVTALRKNGFLVWLDRPTDLLLATADRPLSDSREKLAALAEERRPRYAAAADLRVDASGNVEDSVKLIEAGDLI